MNFRLSSKNESSDNIVNICKFNYMLDVILQTKVVRNRKNKVTEILVLAKKKYNKNYTKQIVNLILWFLNVNIIK